jgi:aminoglycoside phosphotransferase (APT) family kinase protein
MAKMSLNELIDTDRLTSWLDEHVPELGRGPLRAQLISGGTSNAIVALNRGGRPMVLRRPPPNPPPGSSRTMMREAQMLRALKGTAVPHPRFYGLCEDTEVIGAPFYVMERVHGWAATVGFDNFSYPPPFDRGPNQFQIGYALTDGLAALAAVDYTAVGLENFGNPEGFLKRQVDRWLSQLRGYPGKYPGYVIRDIPGLDHVASWLKDNLIPETGIGVIHGDYGSANALFASEPPTRLVAIIDWELSTIGDPLLDLAWMLFNLRDRRTPDTIPAGSHFDPRNFPTRQDLAEYYAEKTGYDTARLDYYLVLAQFKLACIVEYKVAEVAAGHKTLRDVGYRVDEKVMGLIAEAKTIAKRARL